MNFQEILRHITSWEKTAFLIRNNACIPPQEEPVVAGAATATVVSNGHVVLNGVKREHEHEVVMTLAGLFKVRNTGDSRVSILVEIS